MNMAMQTGGFGQAMEGKKGPKKPKKGGKK